MGLDMYIYKGIKPTVDNTIIQDYFNLENMGYTLFREEDINQRYRKNLKKVAVLCTVNTPVVDIDAFCKYLGVTEEPHLGAFGMGERVYYADGKRFTVKDEEFKKFLINELNKFWVIKLEEVAYWRNNFDVEESIYGIKRTVPINNCGYYKLTPKQLAKIDNKTDYEFNLSQYSDDILFYHEWY